jgi:hypothetical protein
VAGHNAFQRNAFQRNAFQIVYSFTPTSTGGVIVSGGVTAHFKSSFHPVSTGGVIVGGSVTAHYQAPGDFRPTSTGGVVAGGSVTARFHSATPTPTRFGGAGPWRVINRLIRRPKRYKPRTSGGVVVGGSVRAEFFSQTPEFEPEVVTSVFLARSTGGVVIGGGVFASYAWTPPPPDSIKFRYIPIEPVAHAPVPSGGIKLGGGVIAAFKKAPELIDYRVARLRKQIEEEDELLLLGAFDE